MTFIRSWLFVPGNQERRLRKVKQLEADAIIYDLEDAVPPAEKGNARQAVRRALEERAARRAYVRVNDAASGLLAADLEAVVCEPLHGIVLAKAGSAAEIAAADAHLGRLERDNGWDTGRIGLIPLVETAAGVYRALELASGCSRVRRLAFGSVDYALDIGAELTGDGLELLYPRCQLVLASRVAGIEAPIDAAFIRLQDAEGLRRETRQAKQLGFEGKLVVHPDQIAPVNELFAPTREEIAEAQAVVEAFRQSEASGQAAIRLNGGMIDYPVVHRCRKLLETARGLGLLGGA
ncbi:MAG: CoA ester lyase [Paenibacillaceae bacterium]|nr:CoA ester lyase [Paenibacillaceae bacterium]